MNLLTSAQKEAIAARGNVLVIAGAGTGKTRTLVERCCALLLEERCSLDEILMVTFTEAAAAEMRRRIRSRLVEISEGNPSPFFQEQIALLDTASISTLHSFCLRLLREHFHDERLKLDPQFSVLSEEQAYQLRQQTLDALLEEVYTSDSKEAAAARDLLGQQAHGADRRLRDLIWQVHRYSQSLACPEKWFEEQSALFSATEPSQWREWFTQGFSVWRDQWLPVLRAQPEECLPAKLCLQALETAFSQAGKRSDIASVLERVVEADDDTHWPRRRKLALREPLKRFFDEARFLHELTPSASGEDPLAQDWNWTRHHMLTLIRLAREFGKQFSQAKRDAGGVDFADLEQFALQLLWDFRTSSPTSIALEWREGLRFVFVDEYQDINEAQDMILRALSREGAEANRFLVGDVKQSIYRFRLADPTIFQAYANAWRAGDGNGSSREASTISLADNFRSRERLLDFINPLFASLMRPEIGGVSYKSEAELKFAAAERRVALNRTAEPSPRVEMHVRLKGGEDELIDSDEAAGALAELADLEAAEKEARLVALRLRELHEGKEQVWDEERHGFRDAHWRDMVVLLRAPKGKAERFAKEFARAGVPLQVARGGFYDTTEISDLLSLLQLLDNPLQDIPLLAVLHSPLAGFSPDELVAVRVANRKDSFWIAMQKFRHRRPAVEPEFEAIAERAREKVDSFLKSFEGWRRQARQGSLSDCLEKILTETHYEALLLAQSRGDERLANISRLLKLARQFDPYQRQGLYRFLKFVETQRDAEAEEEPAPPSTLDAVRLLSIHQSKGLEFPIVVVADLGKPFNLADLRGEILVDPTYGLCSRITPPDRNGHYPSLPYWLARRRQLRDLLGEETRLLYVALTRAKDRLILTGTISDKKAVQRWQQGNDDSAIGTQQLLSARSYLGWLHLWLARVTRSRDWANQTTGENALVRWNLYSENDARLLDRTERSARQGSTDSTMPALVPDALLQRLNWKYPFSRAALEPAKTSATVLRRRFADAEEEAVPLFARGLARRFEGRGRLSAAEIGIAHHIFLQSIALERAGSVGGLEQEAARLRKSGVLSAEQTAILNLPALAAFWGSECGRRIREHSGAVRRELAFTVRMPVNEIADLVGGQPQTHLAGEFAVIQGMADLVVLLRDQIWLVDFKTDGMKGEENIREKARLYELQMKLYARALARIYFLPVTECWLHFIANQQTVQIDSTSLAGC
jgi:ATP-dependent helicase/nuclease subunit A